MKMIRIALALTFTAVSGAVFAQQSEEINMADSTGLPGDNFSLEGALALFKESKSLEDFEKKINSKDEVVNNLDLNGDGEVDYIKVVTDKKENARIVILQAPVSKTETQDVAVIEIQKDGDNSAFLQILGDETLYGESKIVEPKSESEPSDPGTNTKGPSAFSYGNQFVYVNVWLWPLVPFMFAPTWQVYISPWYWDYYPVWWSPWYPYPWRYHYMSCWHYHHHYHHVHYHHTAYAHQVYAPRRVTSPTVYNRYEPRIKQYKATHPTRNVTTPGKTTPRTTTSPAGRPAQQPVKSKGTTVKPSQPEGRPAAKPTTKPTPSTKPAPTTRPQTKPADKGTAKPAPRPSTQPGKTNTNPKSGYNTGGTKQPTKNYSTPSRSAQPHSQPSRAPSSPSKGGSPAKGKR